MTFKRVQKDLSKEQVDNKLDLSTTQVSILIRSMTDNFMTTKEMIEVCGFNSRKRFHESYITPVLEDCVIEKSPN